MESVPVSPEGLKNLKAQLKEIDRKIPIVTGKVATARAFGDLSENAEYHAAREDLAMLHAFQKKLRGQISNCRVIDPKDIPKDVAVMGATVDLEDIDSGRKVSYTLVGEGEADPLERKILTTSPIGKALLRKKVGDEIEVQVPRGLMKYKVKKINYA